MKENEKDLVVQCLIGILTAAPNNITPGIILKSLVGALGIVIAGTAKDVYNDKMYEPLGDLVKDYAQREGAREIFNSIFRMEQHEEE